LSTMFSVEEGNTKLNDWLISHALPGIAQPISFFAKSYSGEYPETFQVLYSTTDMATASFKKISGMVDITAPEAWTEYSYNLPEGAKYFAIRCTSDDKFMLFVDDITYIPANGAADLEIVGYNVYRDGVKVNAEPVAEATFTDADLAANTTYTFAVSVVYTQGESKTVAVEVTTAAAELTTIEPNVYYNLQILDTDPELFLSAGWQDDKQQVNTLEKDEAGYEQAFKFVPVADKDDVYNIVGADGKVIYASGGWDCFWNDAATETNFADAAYQFSVEPQNGYIYIKTKNGYIGSDGIWNWSKVWTDKGTDKAVKFSPIKNDNVNGINAIETEEDVVYYSIQGIRLANPVIGQPCIRVANGKATKVIIR
ncbi:MAG: choice-of-anchor J domain-containing protein, partial [Muribaculaceae bacterium]|nr:choice-of-anchor J domain-containing protein [Muribaculaceae bacterium]